MFEARLINTKRRVFINTKSYIKMVSFGLLFALILCQILWSVYLDCLPGQWSSQKFRKQREDHKCFKYSSMLFGFNHKTSSFIDPVKDKHQPWLGTGTNLLEKLCFCSGATFTNQKVSLSDVRLQHRQMLLKHGQGLWSSKCKRANLGFSLLEEVKPTRGLTALNRWRETLFPYELCVVCLGFCPSAHTGSSLTGHKSAGFVSWKKALSKSKLLCKNHLPPSDILKYY